MQSKHFSILVLSLSIWLGFGPHLATARDATSFNPVPITVQAEAAGVPIGTIIAWPVATNPQDWNKWLECDGSSISAVVYPELRALVGANTPNLTGRFLRGRGGNAAALGVAQSDAIRNVSGTLQNDGTLRIHGSGVFSNAGSGRVRNDANGNVAGHTHVQFDFSNVMPTANEIRPVNQAVRYLIRALK